MKHLLVALFWLAASAAALAGAAAANADAECLACHADIAEAGVHLHPSDGSVGCAGCHGSSAGHPSHSDDLSGFVGFARETAAERSAVCLGCHRQVAAHGLDVHRQAGVACDGCHAMHPAPAASGSVDLPDGGLFARLDGTSAMCGNCHQDVVNHFAFNERHRLSEGTMSCTSCHEPHDTRRSSPLGGAHDERCTACHRDAAGPFVFEHGASRVEGCMACHEPHGSPNRHLLTHQQVGELCHTCHVVVPQFHIGFVPGAPPRFGLDTVCTNCHATIHGSNFDRNFLR